jgi:NADH:ubiquinone oxidoreductase subunit 3 (subunit A)
MGLIKALAAATGVVVVLWALSLTPVGLLAIILLGVFVFEPLEMFGFADFGESSNGFFVPNHFAMGLAYAVFWFLIFLGFWGAFLLRARRERDEREQRRRRYGGGRSSSEPRHW